MAVPGMTSGWSLGSIHEPHRHYPESGYGSERDIARSAWEPGAGEQRPHLSDAPPAGTEDAEIWRRCWED